MHHRLASNPVRCDLVLYEDRSHYSVAFFFYSLICFLSFSLSLSLSLLKKNSLYWFFALLLLCSYDVMF